jgi:hypothetical protein
MEFEATLPLCNNSNTQSSDADDPLTKEARGDMIVVVVMEHDGGGNVVCR